MPAKTRSETVYLIAEKHLARRDPRLRKLIRTVGRCTLKPDRDHFRVLVRTIISQQLSTRSASSILARLTAALEPDGYSPARVDALTDNVIRKCGFSGGKLRALRDLCAKLRAGTLPEKSWAELDDLEVRELLMQVYGIGPWSVDMFLMFSLGRPDVLPVGDLGLRAGVQALYKLPDLPTAAELTELAEPWRPYRSIATWYFWRGRGAVPQSK